MLAVEAEMTIATSTITGGNGQPAIQVVVTLAVSRSTWTGSLRASSPVAPDKIPQKGWMYRLRLEDDRERYISIESVTTGETWFTATFTGAGPPPKRNTHLKRPAEDGPGWTA